mmetsp:Transcript_28914/g.29255  ORF Transcript_28914/g.29255 Transcript_28914/m.29255 type:complete len:270 (+) Transcript_28914:133-942(+)|eukprot:CAMPEP_0182418068 /NCGR_PEP_ID=MMETSP1167-20130531/2526_1 /TAXON_ID=2988 /ORGANISM="Mallomonas Sp, Strain CCMP3275" /LENGTH=269 /DNA_ID=CAMNT_0024592045 /DNA_START=131 /DNA_END=940 /DNA_ORIENTATION=+
MSAAYLFISLVISLGIVNGFFVNKVRAPIVSRISGTVGGQCWDEFEDFKTEIMLKPRIFRHLGDYNPQPVDEYDAKRKQDFNRNVGKALETLRRQLPMVFHTQNLDFSIFAPQVTVSDGNGNRLSVQRTVYAGVVKSLRLASTFSFVHPSMHLRKIDYVEDCTTIQCQVDIVLPDSIRIDGQAVWEGMFYFSLDHEGLIQAHTFDKKVSTMRPSGVSTASYPWLRARTTWSSELIGAVASENVLRAKLNEGKESDDTNEEGNVLDLLSL